MSKLVPETFSNKLGPSQFRTTPLGPNLVYNGDMEIDAGWTKATETAPLANLQSAAQAHCGVYSRYFNGTLFKGIKSTPFTLIGGKTYRVEAWVYSILSYGLLAIVYHGN